MSEETHASREYRCPGCGREIYSRRRRACEFCDLPLPPEFLLTDAECEAMDQELLEMHQRRERDKEREEEEREAAKKKTASATPFLFG